MDPITMMVIFAGVRCVQKIIRESRNNNSSSSTSSTPHTTPPPTKLITLVGSTSVGKSSTGNALLGFQAFAVDADHNTTQSIYDVPYKGGYSIRDTPGLRDSTDYTSVIWRAIEETQLVVYVCSKQLYRPELELVHSIGQRQKEWDRTNVTDRNRKIVVFMNMQDIRESTMPSKDRQIELAALKEQLSITVPPDSIVTGTACAFSKSTPQIDNLQNLIDRNVGIM
jgi:GTPase Era involved in 16S rRNA processing